MPVIQNALDLKTLKADMDVVFGAYHNDSLPDDERYYNLDIGALLQLPRKFKKEAVVLPTARDVVESAADHVTPQFRLVEVPRKTIDSTGTEQARKLKRFYEAILTHFERRSVHSPYRAEVKGTALYGMGVGKLLYDQDAMPKEPERDSFDTDKAYKAAREEWRQEKIDVIPFTLQIINPKEVVFDIWHESPHWVLQTGRRFVGEMKKAYPNWPNGKERKFTDQVDMYEYWDETHRAVLIDDQSALKSEDDTGVLRHSWGDHPYIITESGFGIDDSEHRPESRFVGILRYIRDVLRSESRNYSIADIIMKAGAWPVRVAEGERANEMPTMKMEYGQVHPMPPGVKVTDLTPQLPPQMVFSFLQMANSIISSSAAPRVVRGLGQPGLKSGFDRQLALGEARLRYGPLAFAAEQFLTNLCRKAATYMWNVVPGSVSVASATTQDEFVEVSAKDFKGNHAVHVKVNVLEPEDEVRKHQDVAAMVTAGLMSPQKGIEKVSPDVDPETELGRILGARLLFSPQIMAILAQIATQKIGSKLGVEEVIQQVLEAVSGGGTQTGRTPANPETRGEGTGDGSRADQAALREVDLRETGGRQ
jgi:hypothetical protein